MAQNIDEVVNATAKSYDDVPYDSKVFHYTQPEHVAAVGVLLGVDAVPLENARVLEIGCASGGNLVSFAAKYPNSYCLGVDISVRQIEEGKRFASDCTLNNLELLALDIRELQTDLDKFDYIICHGVLAWVPPDVQQGILTAMKSLLSDNGIAYVSYNVYPGWHSWEIARNLMFRATAHIEEPDEKLRVAMDALRVFSEHAFNSKDRPIAQILQQKKQIIEEKQLYYIFHEYLESCNHPFYFRDFVAACAGKGLRYLGDTSVATMFLDNFDLESSAVEWIKNNSRQRYDEEEYMDYLTGRTFRCSLIVQDHVELDLSFHPQRLNLLSVCTDYRPVSIQPDNIGAIFSKSGGEDLTLTLNDEFSITVFQELVLRMPHPVDLPSLLMAVWTKSGEDMESKSDQDLMTGLGKIANFLLQLIKKDVVQASFQPALLAPILSDKPKAWKVAQAQAKSGNLLTNNFYCRVVPADALLNQCLLLTDGVRSVAEIKEEICSEGKVTEKEVQAMLEKLANNAFLVS